MTKFTEKGVTYQVRFDEATHSYVYRDEAHLGGPWSNVDRVVNNTSLRLSFRNALAKAREREEFSEKAKAREHDKFSGKREN